jgi:hypothetical protein
MQQRAAASSPLFSEYGILISLLNEEIFKQTTNKDSGFLVFVVVGLWEGLL